MRRRGRVVLVIGAILVGIFFYWQPIRSYLHTKQLVSSTQADISRLKRQQNQLKQRIATVGTGPELIQEARRLGLVKPGEHLFIVKGIAAWCDKNRHS